MSMIPIEVLWRDMNRPLKHFIVKRVPDEGTAEDILQEVFLRIHAHADIVENVDAAAIQLAGRLVLTTIWHLAFDNMRK